MNKNKGSVIIVVVLLILAAIVVFGVIYSLLSKKTVTEDLNMMGNTEGNTLINSTPEPSPVSESTDVNVLQKELNDTTTISVDQDFKDLNSSASSL